MSLKFIGEIVAANVISKAITAPTNQQIEAERQREFLIEKERVLRTKGTAMVSDLISKGGKDFTPEQIVKLHTMADEEVNKIMLADYAALTHVPPVSNNAADAIGRFVGGFVIGIIALIVLFAVYGGK